MTWEKLMLATPWWLARNNYWKAARTSSRWCPKLHKKMPSEPIRAPRLVSRQCKNISVYLLQRELTHQVRKIEGRKANGMPIERPAQDDGEARREAKCSSTTDLLSACVTAMPSACLRQCVKFLRRRPLALTWKNLVHASPTQCQLWSYHCIITKIIMW